MPQTTTVTITEFEYDEHGRVTKSVETVVTEFPDDPAPIPLGEQQMQEPPWGFSLKGGFPMVEHE